MRNTLLAINIADDYYKEKKKASEYRTETQLKDKMVLDMKHEIIELQDTIKKLEKERIMKGTIQYGRSTCQFFQKYYSG